MKRRVRLALGFLISLVFLYLAMRRIEWPELWRLFGAASYVYLIPALLLLVLINVARAYRWRLLLAADTALSLGQVYRYVNIGYLFNNILPAKAGELVRAYLVSQKIAGGIGQGISSLLIERLLDVLTLVILLVVLIPFVALPDWAMRGGLLFGAAAIGGTIVLVVLAKLGQRSVDWLWRWVGHVPVVGGPKIKQALENLLEGFGVLIQAKLLPGIILSSLLIWLGYASFNYLLMVVFRINYLPFAAACLVLCTTGFSMVIPSSPGAMGVFEWAGVQALLVYDVPPSLGFGYMLGLHMFTNISLIVFGLIGLAREGVSYASLRSEVVVVESVDGASTSTS